MRISLQSSVMPLNTRNLGETALCDKLAEIENMMASSTQSPTQALKDVFKKVFVISLSDSNDPYTQFLKLAEVIGTNLKESESSDIDSMIIDPIIIEKFNALVTPDYQVTTATDLVKFLKVFDKLYSNCVEEKDNFLTEKFLYPIQTSIAIYGTPTQDCRLEHLTKILRQEIEAKNVLEQCREYKALFNTAEYLKTLQKSKEYARAVDVFKEDEKRGVSSQSVNKSELSNLIKTLEILHDLTKDDEKRGVSSQPVNKSELSDLINTLKDFAEKDEKKVLFSKFEETSCFGDLITELEKKYGELRIKIMRSFSNDLEFISHDSFYSIINKMTIEPRPLYFSPVNSRVDDLNVSASFLNFSLGRSLRGTRRDSSSSQGPVPANSSTTGEIHTTEVL